MTERCWGPSIAVFFPLLQWDNLGQPRCCFRTLAARHSDRVFQPSMFPPLHGTPNTSAQIFPLPLRCPQRMQRWSTELKRDTVPAPWFEERSPRCISDKHGCRYHAVPVEETKNWTPSCPGLAALSGKRWLILLLLRSSVSGCLKDSQAT
jgi:hypothetical protein